jgi:hypothetical protein
MSHVSTPHIWHTSSLTASVKSSRAKGACTGEKAHLVACPQCVLAWPGLAILQPLALTTLQHMYWHVLAILATVQQHAQLLAHLLAHLLATLHPSAKLHPSAHVSTGQTKGRADIKCGLTCRRQETCRRRVWAGIEVSSRSVGELVSRGDESGEWSRHARRKRRVRLASSLSRLVTLEAVWSRLFLGCLVSALSCTFRSYRLFRKTPRQSTHVKARIEAHVKADTNCCAHHTHTLPFSRTLTDTYKPTDSTPPAAKQRVMRIIYGCGVTDRRINALTLTLHQQVAQIKILDRERHDGRVLLHCRQTERERERKRVRKRRSSASSPLQKETCH